MANLPAGDKTTQLRIWLDANASGSDVQPKSRAALATALTLLPTADMTTLLATFIQQG